MGLFDRIRKKKIDKKPRAAQNEKTNGSAMDNVTEKQDYSYLRQELELWEEARKCFSAQYLEEKEYQFLQCIHRGGVEPDVAAEWYGFVIVNGHYEDREVYEQYQKLMQQRAANK